MLILQPGAESEVRYPFEGEEFGYVLEGKITLVAGENSYNAKKGEAFYINGAREHKIVNTGATRAKIIWVTTPSNF